MEDKDKISLFVKYVRELGHEPYLKSINSRKYFSMDVNFVSHNISFDVDLPDESTIRSFVTILRDFFNNEKYCVREIRRIVSQQAKADQEIYESFEDIEQWWENFCSQKIDVTTGMNTNGHKNRVRFKTRYKLFNDYLYACYVHKDPDKKERYETPFYPIIKNDLILFVDYAFKYLFKLECILTVAIYRKIFD